MYPPRLVKKGELAQLVEREQHVPRPHCTGFKSKSTKKANKGQATDKIRLGTSESTTKKQKAIQRTNQDAA